MAQSEVFNIKAVADFSQPEKEVQRLRGRIDREINSAFRNMEKSFGQPLGHITGRVDDFASSLQASNARVIAFGASAGIVFQVSKAFRELVRSTIQVEKSMADIQVVLNSNVKQLESYRSGIFRIAKETGQSFFEVSKAATELARQGLTAEKTLVRLKDALVLSRLSGMDTMDSVEALTAAINGFGETVIDSTRLVNKFAEVDQKFAVSSQDLAEAFKRVGSTAVDAGVSIDELIALVTSAQQITARGGSVIGNSFKTIFTRIQRPQVLEDLEEAGIKVRNFSGESLKAVDVLRSLANSYDGLASSQKSFVSEAVGGVFQINVLKALLKDIGGDFSIFSRALESSANASDAAARKNEILNQTLDSLINKSVENLREFGVVLGEVTIKPAIVKILSSVNYFVELIIKNKDNLAGVFDIIGKVFSGPALGLVIGSLTRLFLGFGKFALEAGAQIAGLTKRQEDVARIQKTIENILVSQPEIQKRIAAGASNIQREEMEILKILRMQTLERERFTKFASGAASAAFASGLRVDTRKKTLVGGKDLDTPNFADPIRAAVQREIESGVPKNSIRVAVDSRLKSTSNPHGFGVYNTIDEPLGIGQGIARSRNMGIDPRKHGVPNFAFQKKKIINPTTGESETILFDPTTGKSSTPEKEISRASISSSMREQAKLFAKEFEKVLTNPRVSKTDKENLVSGVSEALKKGHPLSVKNISELQSPEAKEFIEKFKGKGVALTKEERSSLKGVAYRHTGDLGFRERRSTFTLANDPTTGEAFVKSQRTGKFIPVSNERVEQLRRAQSNRDARERRGGSPFAPMKLSPSLSPRTPFLSPTVDDLISNPNMSTSKYGPRYKATSLETREAFSKERFPVLRAGGVLYNPYSAPTTPETPARKQGYLSRQLTTFPTFSGMFGGSKESSATSATPKQGMVQRVRNMDPMHKMGILAAGSFGVSGLQSGYESLLKSDTSINENERNRGMLMSGAVGNVLTGALMGGAITAGTPLGMMGGAVIGAALSGVGSIVNLIKEWNSTLPQLQKNLQESSDSLNGFSQNVQTLMSSFFEFDNVKKIEDPIERKKAIKKYYQDIGNAIQDPNLDRKAKRDILALSSQTGVSTEEKIRELDTILKGPQRKLESEQALDDFLVSFASLSEGKLKTKDFSMGSFQNIEVGDKNILGKLSELSEEDAVKAIENLRNVISGISDIKNVSSENLSKTNLSSLLDYINPLEDIDLDIKKRKLLEPNAKGLSNALQIIGFEKDSKGFESIMKEMQKDLMGSGDAAMEFSSVLINLIALYNGLSDTVKDTGQSLSSGIEEIRKNGVDRILSIFGDKKYSLESGITQALAKSEYMREMEMGGLKLSPMTSVQRQIRGTQISNESERAEIPFKQQLIFGNLAQTVISKREGLESLLREDASMSQKNIGESLDSLFASISSNLLTGDFEMAQKELENGSQTFVENASKIGGALYEEYLPSLKDLELSFISSKEQADELSKALERRIELGEQELELLRKRVDPKFGLGSDFRSLSVNRNAERRFLEGSDPKTEITSSMRAFREEMGYTVNDFYTDFENSARDAAQTFKSEFKNAFTEFRRGTLSAGEALKQMAMNVLDRIATNASNMAIDSLLSSAFGGASNIFAHIATERTGGMVRKRYADGGVVTGGSGVVDDVPALLTSGEMVINREAVRTYGSDFFQSINQKRGVVGRLENQFSFLDNQGNPSSTPTQGQARISAALSNIGATNDLMRANTERLSREERFVNYIQARRQYDSQKSQAMKRYERGIRQQAIGAGVSAAIGIGGSAVGSYMDNRAASASASFIGPQQMPPPQTFANDALSSYKFKSSGFFSGRNSGGLIPTSGSSNRDTMNYSLTGGEGVIRKEAVNMYGPQFINDINSGRAKTMRFGSGSSDSLAEIKNLPSSIDRLSNTITTLQSRTGDGTSSSGSISNNFNFSIEIKAENGQVNVSENNQAKDSKESGLSSEDSKRIGEAVKIVSQQAIIDNLREGGLIYNAIRRR